MGVLAGLGVFGITLMSSVGNAVGAGLGLSLIFGGSPVLWTVVCTIAVSIVLAFRNVYGIVEKALLVIVVLMGTWRWTQHSATWVRDKPPHAIEVRHCASR